jgi:glutathione S-transferase
MFGAKVEIALREKGLEFDLEMVPYSRQAGYEPKHPEILRVNPKRQVPVLIDEGLEIFDSTQIFEYLEDRWPEPRLWPASPLQRARARQLELGSDEVFFPHVIKLMGLRANPDPVDSPAWIQAREGIEAYYARMEKQLEHRSYLADQLTYGDIAFYMAQFFAARHTVPMAAGQSNLLAWRSRMAARPAVKQVVGTMVAYLNGIGLPIPDWE